MWQSVRTEDIIKSVAVVVVEAVEAGKIQRSQVQVLERKKT